MQDLQVGDFVETQPGVFSRIVGWAAKFPTLELEYVEVIAEREDSKTLLELTPSHMIAVEASGYHGFDDRNQQEEPTLAEDERGTGAPPPTFILAVRLRVNDTLPYNWKVTSLKRVLRTGAYAPFTAEGQIIVDSLLSSEYARIELGIIEQVWDFVEATLPDSIKLMHPIAKAVCAPIVWHMHMFTPTEDQTILDGAHWFGFAWLANSVVFPVFVVLSAAVAAGAYWLSAFWVLMHIAEVVFGGVMGGDCYLDQIWIK
jgi:Hint module.